MDLRLNLMVRRGGTTTVRAAERSPRRSSSLERSSAAAWSPSLCVSSEEEEGRSPEATSMCWGDAPDASCMSCSRRMIPSAPSVRAPYSLTSSTIPSPLLPAPLTKTKSLSLPLSLYLSRARPLVSSLFCPFQISHTL